MVLIKLLFDILGSVLTAVIEATMDFIKSLVSSDRKTEYDADFAPVSELLSSNHKGFTFGDKSLSIEFSYRSSLIFGKTGSGKGVGVLCPTILNMMHSCSMLINDPSQELWNLCSGALQKAGVQVKILNFCKPSLGGFNPLARAKSSSDIKKLSQMLVLNALGPSRDQFWNLAAIDLLTVLLRIVKYAPEEQRNLHNAYRLLNRFSYSAKDVDRLCVATHDEALIADYKTFVSYDSKMLMSIVATCRTALSIFNDPQVALCSSYDSVDFETWRTQRMAYFIHSSIPDMKYYSVLVSLLTEQCFGHLMAAIPPHGSLPVFILLDEASSLNHLQSLPITYSNIRKYGGGVMAVYQSPWQLIDIFSQAGAKSLEENAFSRLYLPGVNIATASELEQTLGKFEYTDEADGNKRRIRPLMTSSEIRESAESLLLCGNHRAIKLKLRPFYEQSKLRKLTGAFQIFVDIFL